MSVNFTKVCQGPVFRADVQHCQTQRGLLFSVRLNRIKRLSCPGCDSCFGLEESLQDVGRSWSVIGIKGARHGKLYTLKVVREYVGRESGMVEAWDLKLVEYEEEKSERQQDFCEC